MATRQKPSPKAVVYTSGGVDPAIAYPLHQFLIVSGMSRGQFWKINTHAQSLGIQLARDTGTVTVRGADYLAYCEKCDGFTPKRRGPGRPRKSKTPAA